jgi:hypothetical protein
LPDKYKDPIFQESGKKGAGLTNIIDEYTGRTPPSVADIDDNNYQEKSTVTPLTNFAGNANKQQTIIIIGK